MLRVSQAQQNYEEVLQKYSGIKIAWDQRNAINQVITSAKRNLIT